MGRTRGRPSSKNQIMNWSESKSGCRKHPNNNQVPGGVCSSCLRDKLEQLCLHSISTNRSSTTQMDHHPLQIFDTPQSKRVSSLKSASYRRHLPRNVSEVADSVSLNSSNLSFYKSRSVAFASRCQARDGNLNGVCGRKKNGFWSKLLKLTGKGTKPTLVYSTAIISHPRA